MRKKTYQLIAIFLDIIDDLNLRIDDLESQLNSITKDRQDKKTVSQKSNQSKKVISINKPKA